jgi:hypothetical protein
MSWLRSRWTVVALVPAFFLAGFGIVTALAGGSDDPSPSAAPASTGGGADAPPVETVLQESVPTENGDGGAQTTGPTTTEGAAGGATTTTSGNGDGNGGGGSAPPAPPPGRIQVDYGSWDGVFELANPTIVPDFGTASVVGELSYRGGVDCPVGLVRVRMWLYSERGQVVGKTVWLSTQSTGDGAEVTGREPLPFEAYANIAEVPASAYLRFTAVECL